MKKLMLTGASATGKTTVLHLVSGIVKISPPHTTRKPRVGEIEGVDFVYLSREDFITNYQNQYYVPASWESFEYNGNLYGAPIQWITSKDEIVFAPTSIYFALKIKQNTSVIWCHLHAGLEVRKQRLLSRQNVVPEEVDYRLKQGDSVNIPEGADLVINTGQLPINDVIDILSAVLVKH